MFVIVSEVYLFFLSFHYLFRVRLFFSKVELNTDFERSCTSHRSQYLKNMESLSAKSPTNKFLAGSWTTNWADLCRLCTASDGAKYDLLSGKLKSQVFKALNIIVSYLVPYFFPFLYFLYISPFVKYSVFLRKSTLSCFTKLLLHASSWGKTEEYSVLYYIVYNVFVEWCKKSK